MSEPIKFMDAIAHEDQQGWTVIYRTDTFVFEEGLRDGRWVALGYNANGHLMETNSVPRPTYMHVEEFAEPQSFSLNVDGQDLISHWTFGGFTCEKEGESLRAVVTLAHKLLPVRVQLTTKLDGTGVMERWVTVENLVDRPMAVSSIAPLSGGLQQQSYGEYHLRHTAGDDAIYRLGYMKGSFLLTEGDFQWVDLPASGYSIFGRYRRARHRHPMFLLENRLTGECFICQFAWSGGYAFDFDLNCEEDDCAALSFKVRIDAPGPIKVLAPGEIFQSPEVHMGCVFGGLDAAVQTMHAHIRRSVMRPPTRGVTGWVECGMGPENSMDVENTLKALERAHEMGVEVFFIDAGWYLKPGQERDWWYYCGDWQADPERYPDGIGVIREAAHEKGMLFGMWIDAERIGPRSRVYQAHPEWLAKQYTDKENCVGLLNLADTEVAGWMEGQVRGLIDDNKLDMFRLDYNVNAPDCVNFNERDGYLENMYVRYYENVYGMYERLRKDYPDVIFENCAGGGGRSDLGMVKHFTHTWVTDWQIHPKAFRITNGMTMALPPEYVDRLYGGQNSYRTADVTTLMRNMLFARPTLCNLTPAFAQVNPVQMAIVKRHMDIYKRFVRPMQSEARIFHHTPELKGNPDGTGMLELTNQAGTKGMLGVFRLSNPGEADTRIYPRGMDISKDYRVTFDNRGQTSVMSGADVYQNGLRVHLGGALTSELILFEALE